MKPAVSIVACVCCVAGFGIPHLTTAQDKGPGVHLMPGNAVWRFERDEVLDGKLASSTETSLYRIQVINGKVSGRHADDKPDRAILAGEVVEGKVPLISWRQDNSNIPGYSAFVTGKLVKRGRIVGTWYDTAGLSGDFVMTLVK